MGEGPLFAYRARIDSGEVRPDVAQELAMEKLQSLHHALARYRPALGETGWMARFGLKKKADPASTWRWGGGDLESHAAPRHGLYIFGEVGRGKSMLMDLFFHSASIAAKKRVHFHEFMRDIHAQIHKWRQTPSRGDADPIPKLARAIASEAWLLCLDELQVTDIADAMIVGRLFQCLLDDGVILVITSNRHPNDLYKDGLQRERFIPFIKLMGETLDILELNSDRDYRLGRKKGLQVYHSPLDESSDAALEMAFARLTEGASAIPHTIEVNGRQMRIPLAAVGVARFAFSQLCGTALGPSDYLALASRYHTLVLSDIPILSPANKDEARRFVTLVDALYERKVTLICSAAAPPETLYPTGVGAFEFQRTVSRLMEMQAEDYVTREWVG